MVYRKSHSRTGCVTLSPESLLRRWERRLYGEGRVRDSYTLLPAVQGVEVDATDPVDVQVDNAALPFVVQVSNAAPPLDVQVPPSPLPGSQVPAPLASPPKATTVGASYLGFGLSSLDIVKPHFPL